MVFNTISSAPAQAAERPFPDYDLSFEWIHGQVDENWKQGDPGDGCIRSDENEVTRLSHFGFKAKLNPCDGVRTTMKFKYDTVDPDMAPTLNFRLGVTWQYTRRSDNDLPILEDGRMDMPGYVKSEAPNFELSYHKTPGVETQHMYFTYKKNPGTFKLSKQAEDGTALAGAKFELYQLVNDKPSPCGIEPDLTNTEEITVCPVRTPSSPSELQEMLNTAPANCESKLVRKVVLEGFNADGSFATGVDGTFKPAGKPALEPGKYFVRETSAPKDYEILNEYIPFEVPLQTAEDKEGNLVSALVPANVNVKNYKTPPPPTTEPSTEPPTQPTTPPTPHLPKTGVAPMWPAAVILFIAGAVLTVIRRKNAQ
ncbi:prealbumin-like fold domain-containing protein [Actinomyces sp. S4-C9]|uniref:prealbumin-like fold domain-containing protein n=1 Tax=Actinomyces sp. S4-C9 TaxID=1219581 RepID=UPI0012EC96A9|nr:prealbumin-like fold domain-containing protein [Actinomyces sp. S4-C9]